jgi:hypothetical protein
VRRDAALCRFGGMQNWRVHDMPGVVADVSLNSKEVRLN